MLYRIDSESIVSTGPIDTDVTWSTESILIDIAIHLEYIETPDRRTIISVVSATLDSDIVES